MIVPLLNELIGRTRTRSRSGLDSGSRSRSGSGSGSRSGSGLGLDSRLDSRLGSGSSCRHETVEVQLWDDVSQGDMTALAILFDRLEEGGSMLLEVGNVWVVRSATWLYVGLVIESTAMGVTLSPGAWKVPYLHDEGTWLATGKFAQGDEAFPCPGKTFIPTLWIGPSERPCDAFLRQMSRWKRTHQPEPFMAGQ